MTKGIGSTWSLASKWIGYTAIFLCVGCVHSVVQPGGDQMENSKKLMIQDWNPEYAKAIDLWIQANGRGSKSYDDSRPPVATFDWDGTVILNDIGEALLAHLSNDLEFSFNADFFGLFPEQHREEIRKLHAALQAKAPGWQNTPEFFRFRKLMVQTYEELCREKGKSIGYKWAAQLLTGMSVRQVREKTRQVLKEELQNEPGTDYWIENPKDPRPFPVARGIRYYPQMRELIQKLQHAGIEVWVVSASVQWAVEAAAEALGIPSQRVLGVLLGSNMDGILTSKVLRFTYKKGKVDAILKEIGRPPLFAAGDSDGDIEMLSLGAGPRLLLDRGKKELNQLARQQGWMLQAPFYSY